MNLKEIKNKKYSRNQKIKVLIEKVMRELLRRIIIMRKKTNVRIFPLSLNI